MGNATGPSKHEGVKDKLMMLSTALLFIMVGLAAFWFADEHHVNPAWVLAAIVSMSFFPVAGWDYRNQFKRPSFLIFFILWMFIHGLMFFAVMSMFGWRGWIPFVFVELFLFYLSLSLIFKLPPPSLKGKEEN